MRVHQLVVNFNATAQKLVNWKMIRFGFVLVVMFTLVCTVKSYTFQIPVEHDKNGEAYVTFDGTKHWLKDNKNLEYMDAQNCTVHLELFALPTEESNAYVSGWRLCPQEFDKIP
ncbi:hypothetical protein P879_08562 [Paragonimus westermani]|uniref:Transmembrane protein n=1 Tax=Paragonimus westermani TaxID=34504 RepID=A0A8T0DKD4_9TREM|nr:hypothetical protein P879_08562 [Paragonimus westermani]